MRGGQVANEGMEELREAIEEEAYPSAIRKHFSKYSEIMNYLDDLFKLTGQWEAYVSWSPRGDDDDRPYRLLVLRPSKAEIAGIERRVRNRGVGEG